MDDTLADRLRARLADLGSQGLLRRLRPPAGIDLASNDYLGLAHHPRVAQAFAAAAAAGCGSTGSRLLRGHREAFAAVERRFAAFKGTERSLYFSSGYLANLAVLATLPEAGDIVYSDALNHASLIDGLRLSRARRVVVVPHADPGELERRLAADPSAGQRFVVIESVYSMDGDLAPLADYAAVCRRFGAALVVDEAHAVGIYGDDGSGLIRAAGVADGVLLSINPAGKALGAAGAFVAGPAWVIDYLEQRARTFVFSTAPPPALAAAIDAALDVVADEPERRARLLARARFLRERLAAEGFEQAAAGTSQIVPIMVGGNAPAVGLAEALQRLGFDVRAIRPPTVPPGTARLRVSVNAGLTEEQLGRFAAAVRACRDQEEGQPCAAVSS